MKRSIKEAELDNNFARKRSKDTQSGTSCELTRSPIEEALPKDLEETKDDIVSELLSMDTLAGGEEINGADLKFTVLRKVETEEEVAFYLGLTADSLSLHKTLSVNGITDKSEFCVTTNNKWMYDEINTNDTIRVIGTFDPILLRCDLKHYDEDIYKGYIILDPDTYLSSTLISTTTECAARGYYDLVFPRTDPSLTYPMVLGKIVHDMLESALLNAERVNDNLIEEALKSKAIDLQVCNKTVAETKEDLVLYMMQMVNLLEKKMVIGKRLGHSEYMLREICAVEQKLVSSVYSLKGQIDVTLLLNKEGEDQIAALEIKTGKDKSLHMVQACLYALLLQELKVPVSNDQFLLYIKRGAIQGVKLTKHDYNDIIKNRNRVIKLRNDFIRENKTHMNQTQGGSKCLYCNHKTFCYMYNKCFEDRPFEGLEQFDEIATLKSTLTKEVEEYFKKWNACIVLEQTFTEHENKEEVIVEDNVMLNKIETNTLYFKKIGKLLTDLDVNNYVDIYCTNKPMLIIGSGQITSKEYSKRHLISSITIVIQDTAMLNFQKKKYNLLNSLWSIRCSSINCPTYKIMRWAIMELCTKQHKRLRELLIEAKPPEQEQNDLLKNHKESLKILNTNQLEAINKIVNSKDYQLVLGVPGSGKSTLISVLLQILALEKKKVLITTHTNSALDNVLIKLKECGAKFVRVSNNKDSVHPAIRDYMSSELLLNSDSYEEFHLNIISTFIFGATVYGTTTDMLKLMIFDYCIVDEASQIIEPACIAPLISANKFVLIGDHHQLNPLVNSPRAKKLGMQVSLFERLCKLHPEAVTTLKKQYRMNKDIMLMSNEIVYQGIMEPGADWVLNRSFSYKYQKTECEWMNEVFNPERSVIFVNTDIALSKLTPEKLEKINRKNKYESWIIMHLVKELIKAKAQEEIIGVITPYVDQYKLLRKVLKEYRMLDVYTIDKSQGIDKDFVIVSCVKQSMRAELLKDVRRINVAFTRAKSKLVIIGSLKAMKKIETLEKYMEVIVKYGWVVDLKDISKEKIFVLNN